MTKEQRRLILEAQSLLEKVLNLSGMENLAAFRYELIEAHRALAEAMMNHNRR